MAFGRRNERWHVRWRPRASGSVSAEIVRRPSYQLASLSSRSNPGSSMFSRNSSSCSYSSPSVLPEPNSRFGKSNLGVKSLVPVVGRAMDITRERVWGSGNNILV